MSTPEEGLPPTAPAHAAVTGEGLLDRAARLPPALLLAVAAILHLAFAIPPAWKDSCTFDEGTHLASGYIEMTRRDFRLFADNPPLAKVFAVLPLLAMRVAIPTGSGPIDALDEYSFAYKFLYQCGNDPRQLLFAARAMNLFWSLLLLGSVYAAARHFFGVRGGFISLGLAACSTPLLANGHLATPDAAITCLFFLTVLSFVEWWERPSFIRAAGTGILLGGSLVAKHSAVLLLPVLGMLALVPRSLHPSKDPTGSVPAPQGRGVLRTALIPVVALAALLVVWATFGFRFEGSSEDGTEMPWSSIEPNQNLTGGSPGLLRRARLLPEGYLFGLQLVAHNTSVGHSTYALGLHSRTGWWWYFPFTFLVKTPLPLLGALAWALASAFRRRESPPLPLILPVMAFVGFAMTRNMNIGLRHILVAYPFLLAWAGCIGAAPTGSFPAWPARLATGSILVTSVLGCLWDAPHFIASFNAPAVMLARRHFLLADANLDWGQDLSRLKDYMDREGIPRLKLCYFGAASPRDLRLNHEIIPGLSIYRNYEDEWPDAGPLQTGDMIAVSVSNLAGVGAPDPDRCRRLVEGLTLVRDIGHSILIYRVPPRAGNQ